MTDQAKKLHDLIADFEDAMLVTTSPEGQLHARPMRIAELENDSDIWFLTSSESGKMEEIHDHPEVSITLQGGGKYVSLSGRASVDPKPGKLDDLWQESYRVWFPDGKDDPRIVLLHVTVLQGEYWDNSGVQGAKYLFKAGKAYLQRKTPNIDESIHSKVKP